MTLLSPIQDLFVNTLGSIRGVLARLRYLAGLRDHKGFYRHWGLERIHGRRAAESAMVQAHEDTFTQVLRSPIRELWVEESSKEPEKVLPEHGGQLEPPAGTVPKQLDPEQLAPETASPAARAHLSSIVAAMNALEDEKQR